MVVDPKPRYSLLASAGIFFTFSAVALTAAAALPLLLVACLVVSYLEDMGTSASVIISTFMGGIYAVVIGSGYGLVASGWVPWEKLVGSGLLFVCALFAATGAYRTTRPPASTLDLRKGKHGFRNCLGNLNQIHPIPCVRADWSH